jgi:hypothetical protein
MCTLKLHLLDLSIMKYILLAVGYLKVDDQSFQYIMRKCLLFNNHHLGRTRHKSFKI